MSNNKASQRVGERRIMSCGLEAEIIAYRNQNDIDIRFENGIIAHNRRYDKFQLGNIACSEISPRTSFKASERLGEMLVMNCGMRATVIRYGNARDVDIEFENGDIAEHQEYRRFKTGLLYSSQKCSVRRNKVGLRKIMNCGEEAMIVG